MQLRCPKMPSLLIDPDGYNRSGQLPPNRKSDSGCDDDHREIEGDTWQVDIDAPIGI
jgi:hypothetical protein